MIEYAVKRSNRKTVTIVIHPGGAVEVRCPSSMTNAQIRQLIAEKTHLIEKRLNGLRPAAPAAAQKFTEQELAALVKQAKADLTMRVAYYAPRVGVTYNKITAKRMRTQWGSCSNLGNLNFNCLLVLMPPHIRDYIVVHELCHRKQMNHSSQFWAEVERILPDYRSSRDWLDQNGHALIRRLPQ